MDAGPCLKRLPRANSLTLNALGGSEPMAKESIDLLQGTLDMLILQALAQGPTHGYGVMRWIRTTSGEGTPCDPP